MKAAEIDAIETKQELDKHELALKFGANSATSIANSKTDLTNITPSTSNLTNRLFLNKLYSEKVNSSSFKSLLDQQEIIQTHANSNCLFGITLKVTEINKICNTLGFEYVSPLEKPHKLKFS